MQGEKQLMSGILHAASSRLALFSILFLRVAFLEMDDELF
jgi:hypothetical protein